MLFSRKRFFTSAALVAIIICGAISFAPRTAYAIPVEDIPASIWRSIKDVISKSGAQIFNNVLRTAVNQLAYDYATYLGSGAPGQKPFFEQKSLGDRMLEAGDSAAGQVIEQLSKTGLLGEDQEQFGLAGGRFPVITIKNEKVGNLNLCAPDLATLSKISLGLTQYRRPDYTSTSCSFTQMRQAWQDEWDQLAAIAKDQNSFMQSLSGYFDPGASDVSTSLILFGEVYEQEKEAKDNEKVAATENQGWIRIQSPISGKYKTAPGSQERQEEEIRNLQLSTIGKYTGDVFVDAANIFLNQLALSAFNKLMNNLGSDDSGSEGVTNQYAQGNTGGVTEIQRRTSQLLQAQFSERADYDVLGQLTSCLNKTNPGPTNCVITQEFAQAITQQVTVAKAIDLGLLDGSKRLGYDEQGREMNYIDGYPYRSLIILRKYRVLPVGWEVAAQYIRNNPQATRDVTLRKLIECYSPDDEAYPGYNEAWCTGLIDPNWVLKIPRLYCGMEGYGPEILEGTLAASSVGYCTKSLDSCGQQPAVGRCATEYHACSSDADCSGETENKSCNFTVGREAIITRNQGYCADEQSCIKENPNGSCAAYGYCTQEQRRWTFNQQRDNSCEARNNTCQSFRSDTGAAASFLQNTLDYSNCGANQVGCRQYAINGAYNAANLAVAWNPSLGTRYFNKNMPNCDPDREGCHQFVRTKDGQDTNLIADGSFERSQCVNSINSETLLPKENRLLNTASAAELQGDCELTVLNASGYLPSPNNRWYVRVNSGTVKAGIANNRSSSGNQSIYIEGAGGLYSRDNGVPSLLPTGFTFEADRYYTLSVSVYVLEGKVRAGFGSGNNGQFAESTATNSWQNLLITYYRPANGATEFYIEGTDAAAKFYIDGVKLAIGNINTSYNDYLSNNVIYQKLLPNYLEPICYRNTGSGGIGGSEEGQQGDGPNDADYRYKDDAPAECYQYARKCNADEVGCEQYTSINSGITVTAQTKPKDLCPSSCVGYDVFVQQPTVFSGLKSAYFIPNTARSCSAQAVGCSAFTNLDKLDRGAEAIEYYSYLRTCIKPDTAQCGSFYTWEGSDEAGYQLKVYNLKKNGNEPASTLTPAEESLLCNADIYKKLPSEAGYNYDCREFYDQNGNVSYHLYSRTITCSDDCHPYRKEVASEQECTAGGGTWDATQGGRCLYYVIPSEGTTCSAAENGCREYTGNIANNIRTVLNDSFEDTQNPTSDWGGGTSSNTALNLGGHSLLGTTLIKNVGSTVSRDESYTISFLAKSSTGANLNLNGISFTNKNNESATFNTSAATIKTDWRLYTFNLDKLNHEVTPAAEGDGPGTGIGEKLNITFSGPVYIDNIRVTEVPNRYYLIENSWQTPDECDQDVTGAYAQYYMLGCSQYRKADDSIVNLHSFSKLCQDSAAGCEQMIDTRNSNDFKTKLYNDTNNNGTCDTGETSCVSVPADGILNVVYDKTKECGAGNKGCSRFGLATTYDQTTTYGDVYKVNDPDQYNTTICNSNAVGCSQWTTSTGSTVYFKDPGDMTCEWRLLKTSKNYAWLKKKISRCGGTANGALCKDNSGCTNQTCSIVDLDEECPGPSGPGSGVTTSKTIGIGGPGNSVTQPSTWAGICDAQQSGCTEYIDPTSKFNENLVTNPDYRNLDTDPQIEYWDPPSPSPSNSEKTQSVGLMPQTIYIVKGATGANQTTEASVTCSNADVRVLNSDNQFVSKTNRSTKDDQGRGVFGPDNSIMFYIQSASQSSINCTFNRSKGITGESVSLRKAVVEYQLAQNLDRTSPNGLVNFDDGAVLFNERSQEGSSKQRLRYNADVTYETGVDGEEPSTNAPLNANVILKVKPDRSCSQWLSCLTYIPDPSNPNKRTCLDMGLCDKLAPDGTCAHFINNVPRENQKAPSATSIANLTGYSKVGYVQTVNNNTTSLTLADYYNLAAMSQVGEAIEVANGNFESGSGWTLMPENKPAPILNQPSQISERNLQPFHIIKKQSTSTADENSGFLAPEGRGILRLPTGKEVIQGSGMTFVSGRRYVLTMYMYAVDNGLQIKLKDQVGSNDITLFTSANSTPKNQWTKQTFGFKANSSSYKISLVKPDGGDAYFDDLRIEPGLNYRCADSTDLGSNNNIPTCVDPAIAVGRCSVTTSTACAADVDCPSGETCLYNKKPMYVGSSCRLYAKDNALGCAYTDNSGITYKGIRGYCLETDPKDPSQCLLWYPVGRLSSDAAEEGTSVNFGGSDVYYCTEARDDCNNAEPNFYCHEFVKVNNTKYWNQRLASGSTFSLPNPPNFANDPYFVPTASRKMDFGNKYGVVTVPSLSPSTGGYGYFGAYLSTNALSGKKTISQSLQAFVPFYGNSSNNALCYSRDETIEGDWSDWKNQDSVDKYDNCFAKYAEADEGDTNGKGYCRTAGSPTCSDGAMVCRTQQSYDFENRCYGSYQGNLGVRCASSRKPDGYWTISGYNNNSGSDSTIKCIFDCYNRAKSYTVAQSHNTAFEAVKKLFPGRYYSNGQQDAQWKLYTWNGSGYSESDYSGNTGQMPRCANNGPRPAYPNDYCYIEPAISNVLVDGLNANVEFTNAKDVVLSFNTQTDPEQLPLKSIMIDWGYKDANNAPVTVELSGNLADINPRRIVHHYDYFVMAPDNLGGVCTTTRCIVKPKVTITDNWGYFKEVSFTYTITVNKP